jgi:hypothetical protein
MMSADAWNEVSKLMWTQWSVAMHAPRRRVVQLHLEATSLISCGFRPMIWTAITRVAAPYQQDSTAMNTQTIFRTDMVAGVVQQARNAPEFRVLSRPKFNWMLFATQSIQLHSLTTWSWVLLENRTCARLLKKFPTSYGNRRFITAFTRARHLSLSWASSIQSTPHIHFLNFHINMILPSILGYSKWFLYLRIFNQNSAHISPLPHTYYMPRQSYSFRFDNPNNI